MATHQHSNKPADASPAPNAPGLPDRSALEARTNSLIVARLHLLLAVIMLARYLIDFDGKAAGTLLLAFAACGAGAVLLFRKNLPAPAERCVMLLAVVWISTAVYATGGAGSPFYPFYICNVMIGAFRFGQRDGNRLALAATVLFVAASLLEHQHLDAVRMAMRATFLLGLGALFASLGEANLRQHRRLALLRDINSFSNPRFGIDRTVADAMARCRVHFGAGVCLLVVRRARSCRYELRIADGGATIIPQSLPPDAPLARFDCDGTLLFKRPRFAWLPAPLRGGARLMRHEGGGAWRPAECADADEVAALCEAHSFISVPLVFRGGSARITICAGGQQRRLRPSDALFLEQAAAQVLPGIETLYLLDRMASMAALHERRTVAHDLHDSAIQPYIGLNASLAALRLKATPDNPLCRDIEQLAAMSAEVIDDLRRFAGTFHHGGERGALIDGPLRRQLLRAKQWYNLDIALDVHGAAGLGDRLCAAVLQLSHEGISNICKHTQARHARLRIACDAQLVRLDIENDSTQPVPHFIPRSITARARALGGYAAVEQRRGATLVRIAIPA
jgi:signal transduction histidine kinase